MKYQKGDIVRLQRGVSDLYLVISNIKKDPHHNDCYEVYVLSAVYNIETTGSKFLMNGIYLDRCFDKVG